VLFDSAKSNTKKKTRIYAQGAQSQATRYDGFPQKKKGKGPTK
jgi:hypothetical protein